MIRTIIRVALQKRLFRNVFLMVYDTIRLRRLPMPSESPAGVLIVRLDGIGDFMLWLSAARALRERYAQRTITLVVDESLADFATGLSLFDEVIPVQRRKFSADLRYRYEMLCRIRRTAFEIVLNPVFSRVRYFRDGEAIVRAAVAVSKVGSRGERVLPWQRYVSSRWYDRLLSAADTPMTELERNAEFMRGLGFAGFEAEVSCLDLEPARSNSRPALMTATSVPASSYGRMYEWGSYYVVVPGAGSAQRFWPPDRFARIADRLYQATGWTGVVCGGPGEAEIGRTILAVANAPLINLIGTTSLNALVEIVASAALLVGNETGAVHIAASVGTPSVCIAGGGHYGRFVPYPPGANTARPAPSVVIHRMPCFNCNWNCIYRPAMGQPAPCIAGIAEDDVWREVERLLREHAKRDDNKTRDGVIPEHDRDEDTGVAA